MCCSNNQTIFTRIIDVVSKRNDFESFLILLLEIDFYSLNHSCFYTSSLATTINLFKHAEDIIQAHEKTMHDKTWLQHNGAITDFKH